MRNWPHRRCPDRCHRCPGLAGAILPFCYGSLQREDLEACTCRPKVAEEREVFRRHVAALRGRINALEAQIADLTRKPGEPRVLSFPPRRP